MDILGKESPSPSYSTVKKWAAKFKRGKETIGDDERPWQLKRGNQ
jgi:hypothetical protein